MSLLFVGMSHRTAPISLLERAALDAEGARALARDLCGGTVLEAAVLATCNRVEVYAVVPSFHLGVQDLSGALAQRSGLPLAELAESLIFAYGDRAVEHLFNVSAGLDSMALGESQVLGQVRTSLRRGQEDGTVGRVLDQLVQRALRVGKRVHSETGLDKAGRSLVEAALEGAESVVGPLADARALVIGAGSMSALAATTLQRLGVGSIAVANRTPARAERLAAAVGGTWLGLDDDAALRAVLATADVVVSCTGAVGTVLDAADIAAARAERSVDGEAAPQLLVDLALPHDVDLAAGDLPGVELVGLDALRRRLAEGPGDDPALSGVAGSVSAARAVVADEVAGYLGEQRAAAVAPTVAALRSLARDVVEGEVARLRGRLGPEVDPRVVAEAELAVHRVTEKLLHTPTVRVKALAADGADGAGYAAVLRELFDLDGPTSGLGGLAGLGAGSVAPTVSSAGSASTGGGSVAEVLRAVAAQTPAQTSAQDVVPVEGGTS
ncbi:glutamyl-tRNA reductase [Quadrisphaera granulorum]|uniref:Glutamyl-tRNA reductase n=1 Tax=Quadrisphaera granulorum TaxID=317664 RepID=A0A316A6Q1_9ACTN|nr:glutamyl-tRNA reductase [Quadrisphaera granulorum]PWJ53263.1 glutamyl-tRNA reductase [Quadrisphaera granulorum]SZE96937.1 glutamyl-tRNA reductase [Quadrisphaera granulorum]